MMRKFIFALTALCLHGASLQAQTTAQRLSERARAQLDLLTSNAFNAARVLLDSTLRVATTPAEKVRGYTLLAFAQLGLKNETAAQQAFEQALRLDPAMRIDSIADLDAGAPLVFARARTIVTASALERPEAVASLHLTLAVPADTQIAADDPRLPIVVQPTLNSMIVATITAQGRPSEILWSDSASASGRRVFSWRLRTENGAVWPPGRYVLRAQATDSTGQATPFQERLLRITRARADTQAFPPPPAASAFAPETLKVGSAKRRMLLYGGSLAAIVAVSPMLGNSTLNQTISADPTAYAVAGGIAVISLVDFLMGRARSQVIPENVLRNQQLRTSYQRQVDDVKRTNNDARAQAPIRITVERSP